MLKNAKAKGTRAELRAMRILELAGYACVKAGGSLGMFDVIALGPQDVRCLQVKSGGEYCSHVEREKMRECTLPPNVSREIWRFPDRCLEPLIERL
jgi:Holliday junction resolvase